MFDVENYPIPIGLLGNASVAVTNIAGDTLYYADHDQVSSSNFQGVLLNGSSATFIENVWVVSASRSTVDLAFTAASGGSGSSSGPVDQPNGVAGLDANTLLKLAEFPATIVQLLNGMQSPASYPVAQLPTLLLTEYAKSTDLHAGTTLSAPTSTGPTTTLTVPALANKLPEFSWVQLNDGAGHVQNVQLASSGAAQNATSITTKSFTPIVSFPSGTTVKWLDWGPALYRATQAAQTVNVLGALIMLPGHGLFVGGTVASDGAALFSGGITPISGNSGTMMLVGQGWGTTVVCMTTQVTSLFSCGSGSYAMFGAVNFTVDFLNVSSQSLTGGVLSANSRTMNLNRVHFDLQVINAGASATSHINVYSLSCNYAYSDSLSSNTFNEVPHGWYAIRFVTLRGEVGITGGAGATGVLIAGFAGFDQSVGASGKYVTPQTVPVFGDHIDVNLRVNGAVNGFPSGFASSCMFQIGGDGFFQKVTVRGWYKGAADDNEIDSVANADVDVTVIDSTNSNLLYAHAHSNTPMWVGTGTAATLSVALTSGVAPASLTVLGLRAVLPSGSTVTVYDPTAAHTQTFTVAANPNTFDGSWLPVADAAPGTATVITLTSPANANFSYPAASQVLLSQVTVPDGPASRLRFRVHSVRANDTVAYGGATNPQHLCLYSEQNAVLPSVTFDDCTCDSFVRPTGNAPLQISGRIRKIEGSVRINEKFLLAVTSNAQGISSQGASLQLTGYRTDVAGLKLDHRLDAIVDKAGHTGLIYTHSGVAFTCTHAEVDLYLTTDARVQVIDSVGGGTISTLRYQQIGAFNPQGVTDTWNTGGYPSNTTNNYAVVSGAGQTPGTSGTLALGTGSGTFSGVGTLPPAGTITVVGSTLPFSYTSVDYVNKILHGVYGGDPGYTTVGGEHVIYSSGSIATDWMSDNGVITTSAAAMGTLDQIYRNGSGNLTPAPGADSGVSEAAKEFRFVRLGNRATSLAEVGPSHDDCQAASFTPDAGVASHVGYVFTKWVDGQAPAAATNSVGVILRANAATGNLEIMTSNAATNTLRASASMATFPLTSAQPYFIRLFVQGNVATGQYFHGVTTAGIGAAADVTVTWTLTGSDATTLGDQQFGYGGMGVVFGGAGATINQSNYYPMFYVASWRATLRATRTSGFTSSTRGVNFQTDGQQLRVNGRMQFVDCDFRGLGPATSVEFAFLSSATSANASQPYVSVKRSRWANPPAAASATLNGTGNVVTNLNSYPVMAHVYGFTLTTPFLKRTVLANDTGVRPQWSPSGATYPAQTAATQIAGASGDHSGIRLDPGDGLAPTYSAAGTMVLDPILD